jgi:arylsulfatase A-like enzyme
LPLLPLQLEFFRRHQLDVQRKYYHERGKQHARAVWRASAVRWLATLLVVMAAMPFIATFFGFDVGSWFATMGLPVWGRELDFQQRFFLALSTSGAALQGWLAAMGLMNQDERNANRYAATASNLDALAERPLDEARVAAARDDSASVRTFIALAQEQISSEHREWVDLRSIAPALSLERLKELSLPRLE